MGVLAFEWSPDGKKIAFLLRDPPTQEEIARKKKRDDTQVIGQGQKMIHIHLIDIESKKSKQLTKGDFTVSNISWAPDGKQIAFTAQLISSVGAYFADIHVVLVESGATRKLVKEDGPHALPKWSPDGKWIAFLSKLGKKDYFSNFYICIVPAEGGALRNLSKNFGEGRLNFYGWSVDSRTLYFYARKRVTTHSVVGF